LYILQVTTNCKSSYYQFMLLRFKPLAVFNAIAMLAAIWSFNCSKAYAQNEGKLADTIQHKLSLYQQKNPASLLFVHFDKTLYTNNENVWFTAYLLNCSKPQLHHTLSVSLINDIDHTVVMEERFLMRDGIGFGDLYLTDSIAPGNYTFMVYTNRMVNHKPEALFTQPVTIKTTAAPDFKAILSINDTTASIAAKARELVLNVNSNDYLPVANAAVSYVLIGKDTVTVQGKGKTDKAGQYIFKVPAGKSAAKVHVKVKQSSQYLHLVMPHLKELLQVKFYPEGGNLVNNLISQVGWGVKNNAGKPIRATGILYHNNQPEDTIQTDSYGMGRFVLRPVAGIAYKVKLINYPELPDTAYYLPAALPQGLVLGMQKAIVDDTLNLQLRSSYNGKVYLHIHNYQQQFSSVAVQVSATSYRKVKVALGQIPKGLSEITLTDSTGKPYAERMFFAHYNERDDFTIQTNKDVYHTREKVQLKLRINSQNGLPVAGYVSVACVQDNRLELKKVNDIESYLYLKSAIDDLPLKERYIGSNSDDKEYLERVVLIKGWRRYSWPDLIKINPADTVAQLSSLKFTGKVNMLGKFIKKPLNFMLFRDSSSMILTTNETGDFSINNNDLVNPQDKPIRFLINFKDGYQLQINNPYIKMNHDLARSLRPNDYEDQPIMLQTSENLVLKGLEKAIQLKVVKVSATKYNSLYSGRRNGCNDYVCRFNIFNCPNHRFEFDNRPPVIGVSYNGRLYVGCGGRPSDESNVRTLAGIYESKQFYGSDYAVVNPTQPEYLSTIYWHHLVPVTSAKDVDLSFYTGDITGKFRIVVQGITTNGVVFKESAISVKKP
jgi:hypothetical protein